MTPTISQPFRKSSAQSSLGSICPRSKHSSSSGACRRKGFLVNFLFVQFLFVWRGCSRGCLINILLFAYRGMNSQSKKIYLCGREINYFHTGNTRGSHRLKKKKILESTNLSLFLIIEGLTGISDWNIGSRIIHEVKQHRPWSAPRLVTIWEMCGWCNDNGSEVEIAQVYIHLRPNALKKRWKFRHLWRG